MKNDVVEVRSVEGWRGVYATVPLRRGQPALALRGVVHAHPDRYSLQVGEEEHLFPPFSEAPMFPDPEAYPWAYLNHGCEPNIVLDVRAMVFVAVRDVEAGEELTFDYNTTEWEMAAPFPCGCGAEGCYGTVAGFRHLSQVQREALLPVAAPHIRLLHAAHPVMVTVGRPAGSVARERERPARRTGS